MTHKTGNMLLVKGNKASPKAPAKKVKPQAPKLSNKFKKS